MRTSPILLALLFACRTTTPDVIVEPPPAAIELPADGATRYTIRFDDAKAHLIDVEMEVPTGGADSIELMMATWTPGSYLVREYARHIEGLKVDGGTIAKTAKNRWTIPTAGKDAVRVQYRLYSREMSVRSNFVDADLAMLNGASTFLARVDQLNQPSELVLELPEAWPEVATALDPVEGSENTWRARDFDELLDSPIVAGDLQIYDFEVEGIPHQLVNWGEDGVWDGAKSAKDVEAITKEQIAFWGTVPYDRYLYLNVISGSGGGLEHKRSTLMLTGRWGTHDEDTYKRWLGLVSHEFFHTWNVKRLRPVELGPFDYENEVLTENLWIAEGFTSYYDDLLLVRAGLIDEDEWFERTKKNITTVQSTPGRTVHPLSETSRDAWIKFYRRDENSPNTTISYYTKGAVVAFLLDAEIRSKTAGTRSLDDVMRLAYERYSGEAGYTSEQFRALASEVAKTDLTDFFARSVDSTDELVYDTALKWYGLQFEPVESEEDDAEQTEEDEADAWIGLQLSGDTVKAVKRGTPAFDAGFNVDDEILAVNGFRVNGGSWSSAMSRYEPGAEVEVLISRRKALRTLKVTLGEEPAFGFTLQKLDNPKPTAEEHYNRLLGIED